MLLCSKLVSASFIMQQKRLDTKVLWNHLRNNWKTKGYTSYESYMSVLECLVIGDFLVGDPPPVIFFGTY